MTDYEIALRNGDLYRKVHCDRCGKTTYEQVVPLESTEVSDGGFGEPVRFEPSGFGSVVIVPYCEGLDRTEITLCPECARMFSNLLNDFKRMEPRLV